MPEKRSAPKEQNEAPSAKQLVLEEDKIKSLFNPKIWDKKFQDDLENQIATSKPYNWGSITDLIDDDLLRSVRKEIESNVHFTLKETDIYKVNQSGDLANLSGLNDSDLSRLPSLYKLRQILYSEPYRDFIAKVTRSGKLSGRKTDMSVNTYTKGCHLLLHDDVIGSRRVSFILYLPDPDRTWKPHYGGALRLYDAVEPNIPYTDPCANFVPQFNQLAFFKVLPGYSFHDVEEVRVDKHRLSIQGWYHIPQEGEDGYIPGEEKEWIATNDSTLAMLEKNLFKQYEFPKEIRHKFAESDELEKQLLATGGGDGDDDGTANVDKLLSADELTELKKFLDPQLLNSENVKKLQDQFLDNSFLSFNNFLNEEYSNLLERLIKHRELNEECPSTAKDVEIPWDVARPPSKWRFMYLLADKEADAKSELDKKLFELAKFLKGTTFRKFIACLTSLIPMTQNLHVRRFRPGNDYTFASRAHPNTEIDGLMDCVLEATLCLAPFDGWEDGSLGGYQIYMMGDESENEDQTMYRRDDNGQSILLNKPASWNSFTLVLRDPSVLEVVKYVSYSAKGSRWDFNIRWDVLDTGDDQEDEDEKKE